MYRVDWEMLGLVAIVSGLVVAGGAWASSVSCHSKWADSEFRTQWGFIEGCRISKDGKRWIPSDNYREL